MTTPSSRAPDIPGYRDLTRIGRGGFSVVYGGEQESLERAVAIKLLLTDLDDADEVRRFKNECRILGRLGAHKHVVDVYDAGVTVDGRPFIVMKFYGRGSLAERLRISGPLPPEAVVSIGIKLAGALQAAHDIGVIHRDIKPDNVLVDEDGEPVLTDFGVAAIADAAGRYTSSVAFSHAHVAPEVLDRNAFGVPSDVYSLGSTLYTLLTGRAAFAADTEARQMFAIINDPPPPIDRPDAPPALVAAIGKAMSKDPSDRWVSAEELRVALEGLAASSASIPATRPTLVDPAPPVLTEVEVTEVQDSTAVDVTRRRSPRPATPPTTGETRRRPRRLGVLVGAATVIALIAATTAVLFATRPADVGPAEVGPADVGPADVGPAEVGPADVGAAVPAGCEPYAQYTGNDGTSVTLFTSVLPPEQQRYEDAWKPFEDCTGIDIVYEGSDQFETQLPTRIAGGNAPDLAWVYGPSRLRNLVESGSAVPAPQSVVDNVDKYWNPAWKAYGTVDGTFYAAPNSSNFKSLVWYSPTVFADKGYTVPTTWDELFTLSDQMVADGIKPWCGGIESGVATGWPSTDWLEQVVLRQSGGDVYDKWVSHEVPFDSPEITAAMDTLAGWMKNPDYVNAGFGNVQTIATTAFQDAGKPILEGKCGMLQQANFYSAQWETFKPGAVVAEDGDVFAFFLPEMDPAVAANPVVGGGEFTTAFSDRPEVQAVQTYLASPEYATARASQPGGWVSANSGVPLDTYTDAIAALAAKFLTDPAGVFRFDASDLMPKAVGAGEEWKQMTAWFAEDKPTLEVLAQIDAAWPAS